MSQIKINGALLTRRGAWVRGFRPYEISKLLNSLPSYTTRGKLREFIATEKFEVPICINTSHYRGETPPTRNFFSDLFLKSLKNSYVFKQTTLRITYLVEK